MLELEHVSFAYEKDRKVISDVSFRLEKGEAVGLVGANGAGKSTIMKLILGLQSGEGMISVDGTPVEKKNLAQIRKKTGYVLQSSDNQMFMPTVLEDMIFGPMNYGLSREEAREKAVSVLEDLGVAYLKDRYNHKISGGEKKMGAIATVLAMEPELILFDEPAASLDPANRRKIIQTVQKLPQTLLIASHDLDLIYETCSRVILLSGGKIAADGSSEQILKDRKLLEENHLELPLRFMYS